MTKSRLNNEQLGQLIYKLLDRHHVLRNSTQRLVVNVWRTEIDYQNLGSEGLMRVLATDALTPAEDIIRIAFGLQRQHIKLRPDKREVEQLEPETADETVDRLTKQLEELNLI